ncbi:hypothetical protein HHK36_018691 [Tetracentron sinense]|uniref:WRKY domain-containing protein n=1 Tax=Tetracentron sinense TaxID=13715 RepID=A0A835DAJ9_TETSI|nr:hypothetical protein HHK36_018691 [Tetracentron sinense]
MEREKAIEELDLGRELALTQPLSILNFNDPAEVNQNPATVCVSSPRCDDPRKTSETWTKFFPTLDDQKRKMVSPTLIDDGFAWKNYGQKRSLNAQYPTYYFKCTHNSDQDCHAKKLVQKTDEDPPMYETTYIHHHTCKAKVKMEEDETTEPTGTSVPDDLIISPELTSEPADIKFTPVDEDTFSPLVNTPISTAGESSHQPIIDEIMQGIPTVEEMLIEENFAQDVETENRMEGLIMDPSTSPSIQVTLEPASGPIVANEQERTLTHAFEANEVRMETHPAAEEIPTTIPGGEEEMEEVATEIAPKEERFSDPRVDSSLTPTRTIFSVDPPPLSEAEIAALVLKYPIPEDCKATWERIIRRHGDITSSCNVKNGKFRATYIEVTCEIIWKMKDTDAALLNDVLIKGWEENLSDVEQVGLRVNWLKEYFHKLKVTLKLSEEFKAAEDRHKVRLAKLDELNQRAQEKLSTIEKYKTMIEEIEEELSQVQEEYRDIQSQMQGEHFHYSHLRAFTSILTNIKEQELGFDLL